MINYKTSKDYKRLKELLDNEYEVVCFVTYDWNEHNKGKADYQPIITTDICRAKMLDKGSRYAQYLIGVRGCSYINYYLEGMNYEYSFEEICESWQIEFIEPTIIQNQ